MRLRDNTGAVKKVYAVVPVIEERRRFNGAKRRYTEICRNASTKPNGVYFSFVRENTPILGAGASLLTSLFLGNLKSDMAEKILEDLTEKGVADISPLPYQKEQFCNEDYVFDNGKLGAYCSHGYDGFQNGFLTPDRFEARNSLIEDEECIKGKALSFLSDEQLRQTIYDLGNYTFQQLGAMSREEMEEEYDGLGVKSE